MRPFRDSRRATSGRNPESWTGTRQLRSRRGRTGEQRDRSDVFQLAHSCQVASALGDGATDDELAAAVLHDVLEDTDWTGDDLLREGVPPGRVEAVEHVSRSRPEQETYRAFIARVARADGESGRIARRVKLADV